MNLSTSSPFFQKFLPFDGADIALPLTATKPIKIADFERGCVPQPAGSNWCWAAVGKAMVGFARNEDPTLQELAERVRSPPVGLMVAVTVEEVLSALDIKSSDVIDLPKDGTVRVPTELENGHPLAVTIAWYAGSSNHFEDVGHVIAIFGWDETRQELLVFDPNSVGLTDDIIKAVPIREMTNYLEGAESRKRGTWGAGYSVSPNAG